MDKVLIKGVSFYLSNLKEEHIDKLVLFNKEIYNDLEKKSYFIIPKKKDFLNHLKNKSKVLILLNS